MKAVIISLAVFSSLAFISVSARADVSYICSAFCGDTTYAGAVGNVIKPIFGIGASLDSAYKNMKLACPAPEAIALYFGLNGSRSSDANFDPSQRQNYCHSFDASK